MCTIYVHTYMLFAKENGVIYITFSFTEKTRE